MELSMSRSRLETEEMTLGAIASRHLAAEAARLLIEDFSSTLDVVVALPDDVLEALSTICSSLHGVAVKNKKTRAKSLIAEINRKFRLNHDGVQDFLDLAATFKTTFNYHEKLEIARSFDSNDFVPIDELLAKKNLVSGNAALALRTCFKPKTPDETLTRLHEEIESPTLSRKDSKPRDRSIEILTGLFGAYVFNAYDARAMHKLTDPLSRGRVYEPDFWRHLHKNYPSLFSRSNALTIVRTDTNCNRPYDQIHRDVNEAIALAYSQLANHGVMALIIDGAGADARARQWNLYADSVLYAEKHRSVASNHGFYRSAEIARATISHIPSLSLSAELFRTFNTGFSYLDCIVIGGDEKQRLVVLFQKHAIDETLIPCPACRSHNVQGNSYSSLGVRSWECNNAFCPDRSKFNRGKRYSFLQLLKQQAIESEENQIDPDSVRRWSRDVQPQANDDVILEMLVDHYSLVGDTVRTHGIDLVARSVSGRRIERLDKSNPSEGPTQGVLVQHDEFPRSPYFKRFSAHSSNVGARLSNLDETCVKGVRAICGDSRSVLAQWNEGSVDGAVTSPPYYNAREYSKWVNIYTYLHDMWEVNAAVFRVLREGACYLYNIFDYFDNENNVALSAMGEKRMILGAYTVDTFRRIGFECAGNIVWDKGEIEGKRAFNNGNFSPYYQAPFNCWEHILIFTKGRPSAATEAIIKKLPRVLRQKPVIKMVRGKNTHGHTAPFPEEIPDLLANNLVRGDVILDPFAGSMTTGAVAIRRGLEGICVEQDPEYFKLGIAKLRQLNSQSEFF
jgi:DNA modification methylase